jgi:hypothetical protein
MIVALLDLDDVASAMKVAPATVSRQWRDWQVSRSMPAPVQGFQRGQRPRWNPYEIEAWLLMPFRARPANDAGQPTQPSQPSMCPERQNQHRTTRLSSCLLDAAGHG